MEVEAPASPCAFAGAAFGSLVETRASNDTVRVNGARVAS